MRPPGLPPLSLVFPLLLLVPSLLAQSGPKIPNNLVNRYFAVIGDAPFSTNTPPAHVPHIRTLLSVMSHVDDAVVSAVAASLNSTRPHEDVLTTCNHRQDEWKSDVSAYFHVRGWNPPDPGCISDVYGASAADGVRVQGDPERKGTSKADVYNAVLGRARELSDEGESIRKAVMSNWTSATRATDFVYVQRTQTCSHDYATFVRLDGNWYLASTLTNENKDVTLETPQRQYLHEYVRAGGDEKMADPAEMNLPKGGEAEAGVDNVSVSTVLATLSGSVSASGFGTVFADDNIAVQDALRLGEHATQQAGDATTPSNIAILVLPLAMNLVPVALVADVNSIGMLLYTLLTDVLTAVPLAIKGVEVLAIGSNAEISVVTRVTGAQLEKGGKGEKAGEIWVARCEPTGNLKPTGVALLMVALVFMVGGVAAEFVAKRWVKRRRKHGVIGDVEAGQAAAAMVMAARHSRQEKAQ